MDEQNEQAWIEERKTASKFLAKSVKPRGNVLWVDDGKEDVLLRLSFKDMVTLLATYGVERMCSAVTKAFGESDEGKS